MNCQDFENLVIDLARDQLMDAATRRDALRHALDCPRCALRLDDERKLTAGLRALAASASRSETPARVEAALLAAFRECATAPTVPPARQPVAGARRWLRWALGAAAAALVLITLAAVLSQRPSLPEAPQEVKQKPPAPQQQSPQSPKKNFGEEKMIANQQASNPVKPSKERPKPSSMRRNQLAVKNSPGRRNDDRPEGTNDREVATAFIPLVYGGDAALLDGGQIVRVSLPRSALLTLGLPVNMDRENEPVKADVVLGHDGLARAIRFVR